MTEDQLLQQEIKDSEVWLSREKEESTYKRDLQKRIELINWVLENMKSPRKWPRGIRKGHFHEWYKELSPEEDTLKKWFDSKKTEIGKNICPNSFHR
jgi:hypothetical protein